MNTTAKPRPRPMSPFMIGPYYRPQLTSMLSITHRATGVLLAFASVAVAFWLVALASGAEAHARAMEAANSPFGRLVLIGLGTSLAFHFANGIRHLFWDAGQGFELRTAYASGYAVLAVTALAALALAWWFFLGGAAP